MTCPRTLLPNQEVDNNRVVRCCEISQKIDQSPWKNDNDDDDDKYRKTTTNIASCFDSDLDSSCEASWVLNEAFRAQGDEIDYYQLRKNKSQHMMMIPVQEELMQRCKVDRGHSMTDTKQRGTKNSNATAVVAIGEEQNDGTVRESIHRPSFRRPGLEENNSEHGTAPTPPRILHRRVPSTVKPPPKPEKRYCHCCSKEISNSNNLHCTRSSSEHSPSHTFCKDCLQKYVQEWVSGVVDRPLCHHTNALPCPVADCGTDGYIPHDVTEQVCSPVLWEQYQEKIFRVGSITSTPPFASFQSYSYPTEDLEGFDNDINPSYRIPRRHRSRSFHDDECKQGDSGKKVNFKVIN